MPSSLAPVFSVAVAVLQARFVQLSGEVKVALKASFSSASLGDGAEAGGPSPLGALSAVEGFLSQAVEAVAGCTDDWALPDTASARIGAQHLTQVCSDAWLHSGASVTPMHATCLRLFICCNACVRVKMQINKQETILSVLHMPRGMQAARGCQAAET